MEPRLERDIRRIPGVLAVSVVAGRAIVLIEPGADAASVRRAAAACRAAAGWRGRIEVVGGVRVPRRGVLAAMPAPIRRTMVFAPVAAAMTMLVASLSGSVPVPRPVVPDPADAPAHEQAGRGGGASAAGSAAATDSAAPATSLRPVGSVRPAGLPALPAAIAVRPPGSVALPQPDAPPALGPQPRPEPVVVVPRPDPVPPQPDPQPDPDPAPPPMPPAAPPPAPPGPAPIEDEEPESSDEPAKTIGHSEDGKHPNHVANAGDKHAQREPKQHDSSGSKRR